MKLSRIKATATTQFIISWGAIQHRLIATYTTRTYLLMLSIWIVPLSVDLMKKLPAKAMHFRMIHTGSCIQNTSRLMMASAKTKKVFTITAA
jgi:hypothetical protein